MKSTKKHLAQQIMEFKNKYEQSQHGGTSEQFDELTQLETNIKNSPIMSDSYANCYKT